MYELCRSVCIYTSFRSWSSAKDNNVFDSAKARVSLFKSSSACMFICCKFINDDNFNVSWEFASSDKFKSVVISNVVVRRASKLFVAPVTRTNEHASASLVVKGLLDMF